MNAWKNTYINPNKATKNKLLVNNDIIGKIVKLFPVFMRLHHWKRMCIFSALRSVVYTTCGPLSYTEQAEYLEVNTQQGL